MSFHDEFPISWKVLSIRMVCSVTDGLIETVSEKLLDMILNASECYIRPCN